jgi:hypothetical protein
MDYEELWEELDLIKPCEECDLLQGEITRLVVRVREFESGTREYEKRKRRLNWAVEVQQRHQSEHDLEEEPLED